VCRILPSPLTKVHQMHYLPNKSTSDDPKPNILAVSTEDGRIIFYDTSVSDSSTNPDAEDDIPACPPIAQLGGKAAGFTTRIKDFTILPVEDDKLVFITGSSDGTVRLWDVQPSTLATEAGPVAAPISKDTSREKGTNGTKSAKEGCAGGEKSKQIRQVGTVLGVTESGNRITCMKAYVMTGVRETIGDDELEDIIEDDGSESDE
jgi:protein MAK11